MKFELPAEITKPNGLGYHHTRDVVFEVEAEDRAEARFLFRHGVHLPKIPRGWKCFQIDLRNLRRAKNA